VGGLLTNQKNIYVYNEKLFNNYYKVGYKSILPAFIFSSNIENNKSCIFEAMILNIVNSALYDTDLNFYGIFYKIMSNDDNFAIMVFFIKMLSKIYVRSLYITIKRVLQLKDLKILRKI
jgi:ribosomal protein S2